MVTLVLHNYSIRDKSGSSCCILKGPPSVNMENGFGGDQPGVIGSNWMTTEDGQKATGQEKFIKIINE